jgi:uncharacterized protein DUF3858
LQTEDSLDRLLALHPSCAHLGDALNFYSTTGNPAASQKIEKQLVHCAPDSLQYASVLSAAGEHSKAAASLREVLATNPLNQAARRMLVKELVLANDEKQARAEAEKLHAIAPNSEGFARLAITPSEILDSSSSRAASFIQQKEFYLPYRRDGLRVIQDSAERRFAGGPAVTVLLDKTVQLEANGALSVYIHRITRVLDKDGIGRFGEVSIPRGADLLELRTVKANGQIVEPELTQQKATISMPALEAEDSIEEEFVNHYADLDEAPEDALSFTFGSFTAPILYARFVVSAPESAALQIAAPAEIPGHTEHSGSNAVHIWEQKDILQAVAESYLPPNQLLPAVTVTCSEDTRARLRDQMIENTRLGLRTMELAKTFQQPEISEYERAMRLYRFVTSRIEATSDWNGITAEDTLANLSGSRTATLLALARAAGLKTALVLAHKAGQVCQKNSELSCYSEPLVRFWFSDGKIVDTDAESSNLPFGAVSPLLDRSDALLAPLTPADESLPFHAALMPGVTDEKSVAEAELVLDDTGSLSVELHIHLGTARAQQVRGVLRNANQRERQAFFEQLAMRVFPGAGTVTGSSLHEDDLEQSLELAVHCAVPQLVNIQNGPIDLDQLVPALGLRALYARAASRKFPLYIDSLYFESAIFHLHLPAGIQVRWLPSEFTAKNEFGEYAFRINMANQQITIEREFRIPVQVIPPEKYEAFAAFARQIDEAERRRISLSR